MNADIDPGYTAEKQTQPPAPASPQGLPSGQLMQALIEQGGRQQTQRPDVKGGERQGSQHPGEQGKQVAAPAGRAQGNKQFIQQWHGDSHQTSILSALQMAL